MGSVGHHNWKHLTAGTSLISIPGDDKASPLRLEWDPAK